MTELHPEIDLRMKCGCGGIGIPATDGEIYFYECQKCKKQLIHTRSCQECDLAGKPHEAEFNDLHDEDGSQFLNFIGEKVDAGAFSWVALHGCKTFRKKASLQEMFGNLPIKYAFTKKAETQGRRAKIHFLKQDGTAKCNPCLDIDKEHIYDGTISDLMFGGKLMDVCKTCERMEFHV